MVITLPTTAGEVPDLQQGDVRETANIGLTPEITSFSNSNHNHSNSAGGGTIAHGDLTADGTNTHAQIDTHLADTTKHFTEASIDHTAILNIGTHTHAQIDDHLNGTDQTEIRAILTTNSANYETWYTVTAGKTLFVTDIVFTSSATNSPVDIGISSASIFSVFMPIKDSLIITLITPLKFTTEQVVQLKAQDNTHDITGTLIGYEK